MRSSACATFASDAAVLCSLCDAAVFALSALSALPAACAALSCASDAETAAALFALSAAFCASPAAMPASPAYAALLAACAALDAGGTTVAVLGCGVDMAYPSQHKRLMDHIVANGAVVSEFPPGTRPDGRNFPIRNRIISGMGLGTLVVEADTHSGALITARTATVQGRDIFAVPGNVGESSSGGTNELIRGGANVVLSARDVIGVYEFPWRNSMDMTALAAAERISDYTGGLYLRTLRCMRGRTEAGVKGRRRKRTDARIAHYICA